MEYLDKYEESLKETLVAFLRSKGVLGAPDSPLPNTPDIDGKWESVGRSYMSDGVREFNGYPLVSLGWMMFTGMAIAALWEEDWAKYSGREDIYEGLRAVRGFDCMDEYILEEVLKADKDEAAKISSLVGDTAEIAYHALMREGFEAGSSEAFQAYVRTLHQLYLLGAAAQLWRMGYRMENLASAS